MTVHIEEGTSDRALGWLDARRRGLVLELLSEPGYRIFEGQVRHVSKVLSEKAALAAIRERLESFSEALEKPDGKS